MSLSLGLSLILFPSVSHAVESVNGAAPSLSIEPSSGVKRVNPALYTARHKTGVWLGMERLTGEGSRLNFWRNWVRSEYGGGLGKGYHSDYKRKWMDANGHLPEGYPKFLARDHNLDTGLYSFQRALGNVSLIEEFWVAFACQNEIQDAADITNDQIEMVVTVSTDRDAPMVTHMGISRSFQYLLNALKVHDRRDLLEYIGPDKFKERYGPCLPQETDYKIHKDLSLIVHSFAAQVMLVEFPHKLFMITTPAEVMRNIFLKKFPGLAFEGDNVQKASKEHWKLNYEDRDTQVLLSSKIQGRIAKLYEEKLDIGVKIRLLKDKKDPSNILEIDSLKSRLIEIQKEIDVLIEEKAHQEAKEIQEASEALPFDMTTSPIRRTTYPEKILQIYNPERTHVVYEYNETQERITIGDLTLTGEETRRFCWFNGGDMVLKDHNPFVTILLKDLAQYFNQ